MNRDTALALGYAVLILSLSSIPGQHYPGGIIFSQDKILHFLEYFGFSLLIVRALPLSASVALGVGIAVVFGGLDELYQQFVPGRDSSIADWVADALGAVLGGIFYARWRARS
jgi:VanZ family protein